MNKSTFLLLAVAIPFLTISAGCAIQNANNPTSTVATVATSTAQTASFSIKELGITFNIPAIYKGDFSYQIKQVNPNGLVAYVYSKSVMAKDGNCGAGSLGAISKNKKVYTPAGEERSPVAGVDIKVGDEYVTIDSPQSFCTEDKNLRQAVSDRADALHRAITTVTLMATVDYFVPKDIPNYIGAAVAYAQTGEGADPALTLVYVKRTTVTNSTEDPMRTAVQAAVALLPTAGGPPHANVSYLKIVGNTAYIALDIDNDMWAGGSAVLAAIRPIMVKNLLQFSNIKNVIFGQAPLATTLPTICTDQTEGTPVITSLSSYTGPVGTKLEIRGCNFAGFEADTNAWIENSQGVKGILYAETGGSSSNLLIITLKSPLCQNGEPA